MGVSYLRERGQGLDSGLGGIGNVNSSLRTNDINIQAVEVSETDLTPRNEIVPQIYGAVANAVPDALDDFLDTIIVDIIRRDQLESDGTVVLHVADALVLPIQFRVPEPTKVCVPPSCNESPHAR